MRIYFYHSQKKWAGLILAVLLLSICIIVYLHLNQPANASAERKIPIYNVSTTEKEIALTFDVAWGDSDFEEILQVLDQYSAKATFFCTGEWVEKYPQHIIAAKEKRHDIQNHSYNHPHVASITSEELINDTNACRDAIKKVLNVESNLYRAPYGEYNDVMMNTLESLDYKVIQWNVDSKDWKETATVEQITSDVLEKTKEGSILLFHVDAEPKCTTAALTNILEQLSKNGYSFVTVQSLLIDGDYKIDSNGTMYKR